MDDASKILGKQIESQYTEHILMACENQLKYLNELEKTGKISINLDEFKNAIKTLFNNEYYLAQCALSLDSSIYSLIFYTIPDELDEENREAGYQLKVMAGKIRLETSKICAKISQMVLDGKVNHRYISRNLALFNSLGILGVLIFLKLCEYLYGAFEKKDENEKSIRELCLILESQLKSIEENTKQTVKNTQASIELGNKIITNQTINRDRNSKELEKIEDKVNKRNRADKRKPLTQEECADILYKQKVKYFKKKENYLRLVGITATKPKLPKDEKMVERTIQRWDQYLSSEGEKGSKPPKGYSRERSRKEFDDWAEALEQIAYEKWEKEQPIIRRKNKRDGLVSTLSPEMEDEENIEEEEDDQETRGQGNLVDRVAHPTKRD